MQQFWNEQSKMKRIARPAIKSQSQTLYQYTACIRHAPRFVYNFSTRKQVRVIRLRSYKVENIAGDSE